MIRIPFFPRRRAEVPLSPERIAHLYSPLEVTHSAGFDLMPAVNSADAKIRLRQIIDAMPYRDIGTADVADRLLLSWLGEWTDEINARHLANRGSIEIMVGQAQTHLVAARDLVTVARADVVRAETEHAQVYQAWLHYQNASDTHRVDDAPLVSTEVVGLDDRELEIRGLYASLDTPTGQAVIDTAPDLVLFGLDSPDGRRHHGQEFRP